jgi:hydroxylamine oxidation protein HaoB
MFEFLQARRLSPLGLPIALGVVGLLFLTWAGLSRTGPAEAPYQTELSDAPADAFKKADASEAGVGPIKELKFKVPGVREPVAEVLVGHESDGRVVPLNWRNNVTEPILSADLTTAEVHKVMGAIREHVPGDAVVLSWWDLSRKIRLISGRQAPLDDPMARGLLLPAAWAGQEALVRDRARGFWGANVPADAGKSFKTYIDAMLMNEHDGAAALAALEPGKTVYVAVHLSDIWKIASDRPDKISLRYKDFPGSVSHGVMKTVREWMIEQKLDAAFAVEPVGNAIRMHYLPKKADNDLLITKLLPFTTSNPLLMKNFKLVYQHRGFWIYQLTPEPV